MATYLNRTLSMVTGNGPASPGGSHDNASVLTDRSLHNSTYENSPLQIFVKAKKKINDIFGEIEEYVVETARFMDGKHWCNDAFLQRVCFSSLASCNINFADHNSQTTIVDKAEAEQFSSYVHKVAAIRQVLNRDHMKVAFFGRTSNGKSSVINAMLRDRILPSGIGHTTNCFCQVEGSDGNEAYLVKEDSDERLNVTVSKC